MIDVLIQELSIMGLDLQGLLVLVVVFAATVLMAFERLGPDLVMFCAVSLLVIAGVITPEQGLIGFSRPETITVAVLFVVAAAVQETGLISSITSLLFGRAKTERNGLLRLLLPTAGLSAFLNNTPIVTMFIPAADSFARRIGISPAKLLMPLSFAAMLGGTCTLIGTSTNLVVSGLLQQAGLEPFSMFELTAVGLPTALAGLLYLIAFGPKLLQERTNPMSNATTTAKEYLVELEVAPDSPLIGRSVQDANLRSLPGLFLVEIRRITGLILRPVTRQDRLESGDLLVFTGDATTIRDLTNMPGLIATGEVPQPGRGIFQVVISHHSALVGRTVKAIEFRRRFGAAILAVHRAGERIEGKIGDIILRPGDTLMLVAQEGFDRAFRNSDHFYLVSEFTQESQARYQKINVTLFALALMVLLPTFTNLSMTVSSMTAVILLLATRSLSPRTARDAVNWPVIMLIGSAFGLSAGLIETGAADLIARQLLVLSQPFGPMALLASIYLMGMVFSLFISNAAAAALLFPIALVTAQSAGLDPRPFAVSLTLAASAAFATPIGYQTNLMVYGPGGYRYLDFTRVGLPLQLICFAVAMFIIPVVWPLTPAL